jgi:plasmid stabilization system protein ParE
VIAIRWSPQAADDLVSIRAFIARDSAHYANLVVQRIAAAIDLLASSPQMGRVVPEIGDPEVREIVVGAYRIVYRYRHDTVEVTTIFHSARLYPANDP